jgi:hypothetical protein
MLGSLLLFFLRLHDAVFKVSTGRALSLPQQQYKSEPKQRDVHSIVTHAPMYNAGFHSLKTKPGNFNKERCCVMDLSRPELMQPDRQIFFPS